MQNEYCTVLLQFPFWAFSNVGQMNDLTESLWIHLDNKFVLLCSPFTGNLDLGIWLILARDSISCPRNTHAAVPIDRPLLEGPDSRCRADSSISGLSFSPGKQIHTGSFPATVVLLHFSNRDNYRSQDNCTPILVFLDSTYYRQCQSSQLPVSGEKTQSFPWVSDHSTLKEVKLNSRGTTLY